MFIADKMFNQLQFRTDINIIEVVDFGVGVDAIVIGNFSSFFFKPYYELKGRISENLICLNHILNLKEGVKKGFKAKLRK